MREKGGGAGPDGEADGDECAEGESSRGRVFKLVGSITAAIEILRARGEAGGPHLPQR